jgi:hypothetical protein
MVPNWVQKSLDNATEKQLKIYKEEWLGECMTSLIAKFEAHGIMVGTGMPTELVEHPFLGLKNTGKWVNLLQYKLFLRNSIGQSVNRPR